MRTLDKFIRDDQTQRFHRNEYVREDGFVHLYVRFGRRYLNGKLTENVLDIANVQAKHPGCGVFSKLIAKIRAEYPTVGIYVENVLEPRFGNKLLKLFFQEVPGSNPKSYYWLPEEFDKP